MPRKQKTYERIIFTPEVIKEALEVLLTTLPDTDKNLPRQTLEISLPSKENWLHDSEDEFFADYRRGFNQAQYRKFSGGGEIDFMVHSVKQNRPLSNITVRLSSILSVANAGFQNYTLSPLKLARFLFKK